MWIDDQVLGECSQNICIKSFVPKTPLVVLGRSNRQSTEANRSSCEADGVPIEKRLGGGGTVILHDGCLVVSTGLWVADYYKNDLYFRLLNQSLIDVFQTVLPQHFFTQRGHSDIVLGDKKLVGTSLFRSRNYLLYQASILVDTRIDLMETYLQHPSAEPDYRAGRKHRDFVMGLRDLKEEFSSAEWNGIFQEKLAHFISKNLGSELIDCDPKQVPHLKSRIGEAKPLD